MDKLMNLMKQLDYKLQTVKERKALVDKLFEMNEEEVSQLTSKQLEIIADYLLHADKKDNIVTNYKQERNKKREVLVNNVRKVEHLHQENVKKYPKIKVTSQDREEFVELEQTGKAIEVINKAIESGLDSLGNKLESAEIRKLKWIKQEIQKDEVVIKELLKGYIVFKRLAKEETVYTFSEDTGYFNEGGDYVLISENKFDFANPSHIHALLDNYSSIKQEVEGHTDSELKMIVHVLEELIEDTELEDRLMDILTLKVDNLTAEEIITSLNEKYGINAKEGIISKLWVHTIPSLIAHTYKDSYEEYVYTFKVKGNYKTCSKCKENKLATTKYFSKDSSRKDGLSYVCKECDKK